jgi:hypothetical protein
MQGKSPAKEKNFCAASERKLFQGGLTAGLKCPALLG